MSDIKQSRSIIVARMSEEGRVNKPADYEQPPIAAAVIVNGGRVLLVHRACGGGSALLAVSCWEGGAGRIPRCRCGLGDLGGGGPRRTRVPLLGPAGPHPDTSRAMGEFACEVIDGTAFAADTDEIAEVVWSDRAELAVFVPYPVYGPVQVYLDDALR